MAEARTEAETIRRRRQKEEDREQAALAKALLEQADQDQKKIR
jgi:hypothetical protein